MTSLESWELASYIITVVGLPLAITVFLFERRKERENEDEEAYQLLSDAYTNFLKLVLGNPDLRLRTRNSSLALTEEQHERMTIIFDMLIALFGRAYLLAYDTDMNDRQSRRWHSWEDYMREWVHHEDFRRALPELLQGEDPDFSRYITKLAQEEISITP